MRVLVTGGTGFVGRHLCEVLDERGHEVTAMSRDPDDSVVPDDVNTVEGDVTDRNSINDVIKDQDAVVHLVALSPLYEPSGDAGHQEIHVGGTETVIEAMVAHEVTRLVHMSALGADPTGLTAYIRAKGEAERAVQQSDLDWVIFRPSIIFGDGDEIRPFTKKLTTPYVTGLPGGGSTPFQLIWVRDIIPMMADAVADDDHLGQTYQIGGPEVLTLADVTRLIYQSGGKSVRIIPIPMPAVGFGLFIADGIPFIPFGTDQYRALKFDNTTDENDIDSFNVSSDNLHTLEDYLDIG
ncbi:complex I NDUFA9 subunit family protein [Natronococcus wangiae]|uniref:complex I NDUFA9 subunit family protein n=1 Tax=Natronococcus wangiae TaxID=3068275 RepID=UPI00273E29D5|nr:complex I NDUFA9 subunit family protein [Natronococcus sp. AD5]